ncbi:MAG: HAMP domain-containing histidine kinase [Oscillospiraceae bacterium]|nr:HAMP domain-containing histidine kinase [Oscillospiraceae bacterium]
MKAFNKIMAAVAAVTVLLFITANIIMHNTDSDRGRPYRVEISRLVREIEKNSLEITDLANCEYVTGVEKFGENFYGSDSDNVILEINGELYRFDYKTDGSSDNTRLFIAVNSVLGIMAALTAAVMIYIRFKILKPFEQLTNVPYELSKGNLTAPVKETKNRFFGRFIWGVDMLRENMEQQKERELNLQRDKKMLLLSLSHDIKTLLSAIKLYSKAISKGLYDSKEKQLEIAESINSKADEIESYVSQIITASREDFLSLDVKMGEFYLSELVNKIILYYTEKLSLIKTEFAVGSYTDCLISGDADRSIEVIQNIMENAVKYGDGKKISMDFSEEDGCILIAVSNSGCSLADTDLPHIFDSFWRGSNAEKEKGSGLGLYICRQLMHKMNGDIFAHINGGLMCITVVFPKA